MQLIVDVEATTGIQSKMSGINEEKLDGNITKNLIDNFSNDLPHNESIVLKNISLFDDGKVKELSENCTTNDKSISINEIFLKTDSTSSDNEEKNKNAVDVSEENSIEHQSTIIDEKQSKEENEKEADVDDDIKSAQNQESLDVPEINNDNLDETIIQSDEQCAAEDDILKLESSLDNSCGSIDVDKNRDITGSSDLENILGKNITENNLEENKIDEDPILENAEEYDKICNLENKVENEMDEDSILEKFTESDKIDEKEKVAENVNINNLEIEAENKMDEDKVLEKVAENVNINNLEIEAENKMDEDEVLEKVAENGNTGTLEIEVKNEIDEDLVLEEITGNDNTSNLQNDLENEMEEIVGDNDTSNLEHDLENQMDEGTVSEEVAKSDNISNLDNEVENKLNEDEIIVEKVEGKNEDRDIVENKTPDDKKSSCLGDNNLDSSSEQEKSLPHNTILSKDVVNIAKPPTESTFINDHSNIMLYHAEKSEKGECPEKDKLIEIKMPSIDDKIADKQNEKENDVSKDIKQSKEMKRSLASKLSNTLDILSDDEDDLPDIGKVIDNVNNYNPSISLVDDDDVMLIEEDAGEQKENNTQISKNILKVSAKTDLENQCPPHEDINEEDMKYETVPEITEENELDCMPNNTKSNMVVKPLLPLNILKNYKKNLADMTREELEEFCISKIVESVVNRSNLGDIKAQLKVTAHAVEEYKKKLMMISKQTRDLQVILKSVQEEQKKPSAYPVTPLKLTRSVGMQVFMTDKPIPKKRQQSLIPTNNLPMDKSNRNNTNIKSPKSTQQIPVPRLVPAASPTTKASSITQAIVNNAVAAKSPQTNNSLVNGLRNSPPAQKPEKRTRMQTYNTVDLTDDEPPSKIAPKCSPTPPVRLVPPQNLLAPQRPPFASNINSPRKVYIPISSPQAQNIRPGQTFLLKSVPPNPGPRPRGPTNNIPKLPSNSLRMNRPQHYRHPAPLPDAMKQYQPPNWKALPPAPDLKLSKVDNGIVISWKIDGYQEDSYEEITSYQIFAYQETSTPPSTALWKKIGDVKALPLPMACTLTQFMAGYKYYFAVRAVDVKSRLGPFSLPGSILLLNKM